MDVSVLPGVLHGERLSGRLFAQRDEIRGLVIARNELAYYLADYQRIRPMCVCSCSLTYLRARRCFTVYACMPGCNMPLMYDI